MNIIDCIDCLLELKSMISNLGKTSVFTRGEIEELLNRYDINRQELERMK